ncbi:MAG: SpoIIE family protein phosphatase [Clostridia bacterium]|nr:SpoIIE family protein phosphatase [Clostridia bacterium]
MTFHFTPSDLINVLFISGGIGICLLYFLLISASAHLRKEVRRYFQVFFSLILLYISAHLARQIMDGIPGAAVRTWLYIVTFLEIIAAGFMTHILALLVIVVCRLERKRSLSLVAVSYSILMIHVILLIVGWPLDLIYYFDAGNVYHRGAGYLLSNLCPLLLLLFNSILLLRHRERILPKIRLAFWIYMIAPIIAIIIQSFSSSIQYIIFASVGASVYMFAVIVQNQNDDYEKQKQENTRLDAELSMASRIQSSMLPSIFPPFPGREEFDIFASMDPAKEVGGDFFDFFLVDEDHLCMVMADVSGKGVPAALFMMASKIILANNAMMGKSPAQILTDTNASICSNNREEMFVTVWLGILEISTGKLTAANAGHEYPVLRHPDGAYELIRDKHGFVIGGMEGAKYKEYELTLEKGSKLFLYTDGVPEATDGAGEMFGPERMLAALNSAPDDAPRDILKTVRAAVDSFVKDAEQFDDLTMLCLEYKKAKGE